MLAHGFEHFLERAHHDLLQPSVDFVSVPHEAFLVLHPLEIAHGDATGVGQNIREHCDAAARQDFVSMRRGRAVSGFGDDAGFDGLGVVQGNDVFERGGDKNVALHGKQLVVANAGSAGHANDCAGTLLVAHGFDGIDAAGIGDPAPGVAEGHDFGFLLGEQAGGGGSGVAKTLNRDTRAAQRDFFHLAGFFHHVKQAARRRFAAPFGTSDGNRLAGDHAMSRMADGHSISVHDPGHGLRVGVDVWRRNVLRRADERKDLAGITTGHALEFALGHSLGVADDATLGAAKGNVHRGCFPGHPDGESFHFVEGNVGMVADAAFAGAARDVVLDAIAGEDFHLAVVHLCGQGNLKNALRGAEDLAQAGIEF